MKNLIYLSLVFLLVDTFSCTTDTTEKDNQKDVIFKNEQKQTEMEKTKELAEQGDARAQNDLGVMYYNGEDTDQDYKQALYWFKKSAEQGYVLAQHNLGVMYDAGVGTSTDKSKAAFWIKKAYENNDKEQQQKAKAFWEANELWKY